MKSNPITLACLVALAMIGAASANAEPPQGPAGSPERWNWCYTKLLVCKQVTDANCNSDYRGLEVGACQARGYQNCEDSWGRGSSCLVDPARFAAPPISSKSKVLSRGR